MSTTQVEVVTSRRHTHYYITQSPIPFKIWNIVLRCLELMDKTEDSGEAYLHYAVIEDMFNIWGIHIWYSLCSLVISLCALNSKLGHYLPLSQ